jgi:hypothetical protein
MWGEGAGNTAPPLQPAIERIGGEARALIINIDSRRERRCRIWQHGPAVISLANGCSKQRLSSGGSLANGCSNPSHSSG